MSQENVEIARRCFDDFQTGIARGEPDAAFDSGLLAADLEWVLTSADVPGLKEIYRGRDGFQEFIRSWTEHFDWSIELEKIVDASDDRIVAVTVQRATGKASQAPVELRMGSVWEFQDGLVIRIRNFFDPADALEAAGLSG
jgi:ketosteroid isomerase-like protein